MRFSSAEVRIGAVNPIMNTTMTRLGGRFQLHERLGEGGMAEVYRATDLRSGHDVALKLLRAPYADDAEAVRRFDREARAAAALRHPNVVAVHEAGALDGRPYIAMELVGGEDL